MPDSFFHNPYSDNAFLSGDFIAPENLFQKISENAERLGDFPAGGVFVAITFAFIVGEKLRRITGERYVVVSVQQIPCEVVLQNFVCIIRSWTIILS